MRNPTAQSSISVGVTLLDCCLSEIEWNTTNRLAMEFLPFQLGPFCCGKIWFQIQVPATCASEGFLSSTETPICAHGWPQKPSSSMGKKHSFRLSNTYHQSSSVLGCETLIFGGLHFFFDPLLVASCFCCFFFERLGGDVEQLMSSEDRLHSPVISTCSSSATLCSAPLPINEVPRPLRFDPGGSSFVEWYHRWRK